MFDVREITGDKNLIPVFAEMFVHFLSEMNKGTPPPLKDWRRLHDVVFDTASERHRVWLAFDGETPIAFCGLSSKGELEHSWVSSDYRGQGLHKELINLRIDAGGWLVNVNPYNYSSIKNIERAGFILVYSGEEIQRYILPNVDVNYVKPEPELDF